MYTTHEVTVDIIITINYRACVRLVGSHIVNENITLNLVSSCPTLEPFIPTRLPPRVRITCCNHSSSITYYSCTGVVFIVSSEELLLTTEKLVEQLLGIDGPYRGIPVVVVFIGEEFMAESNHPLSVQALRLSRWLQANQIAEKWSVFPDRVLAAESATTLLHGLLERTRHTESFLRTEMSPGIADMR